MPSAHDFPDQKERTSLLRKELVDYFGRHVLRELVQRKAAGQHRLAHESAVVLSKPILGIPGIASLQLGDAVMSDVRKLLGVYQEADKAIDHARNLLAEWQTKLNAPDVVRQLQPLRSEIDEQLNIETLLRLDAFLKAEQDNGLTRRTTSGIGVFRMGRRRRADAIQNLDQAIRYWDARFMIREAARAESIQERDKLYRELKQLEGIGPRVVLQLASQLPPVVDAEGIEPGRAHRVLVTPEGHTPAIAYSVLLPPEYSPHHSYPLLTALRPHDGSNEQTLHWWGGEGAEVNRQGASMRRGYILIVPEYLEAGQTAYAYSPVAHQAVIESLRDARKRFHVDSNRVFLAGHGTGADAAFDIGMSHPDEFAGVIPIGGECKNYPKLSSMNGRYTAWYVIGRGFNSDYRDGSDPAAQRDPANNAVFEEIFAKGTQFDFMLVEHLGLGMERHVDVNRSLFDWMDLHVRMSPPNSFKMVALRKTDNRHYWITAADLPLNVVLPPPPGAVERINAMEISPTITDGKNKILITSQAKHFQIRVMPDLIDFEQRLEVRKGDRRLFWNFATPDLISILDELRATGDRTRLPLATIAF